MNLKLKDVFGNLIGKLRTVFQSPSYSRTLILLGIVLLAIIIPVTVVFLGQRTQTQQQASSNLCTDRKGVCVPFGVCRAEGLTCVGGLGCPAGTGCYNACSVAGGECGGNGDCCSGQNLYCARTGKCTKYCTESKTYNVCYGDSLCTRVNAPNGVCNSTNYIDCKHVDGKCGYVVNPKCSDGKVTGTCYTNNSCGGNMHEITPISGHTCGSHDGLNFRICCAAGAPTPWYDCVHNNAYKGQVQKHSSSGTTTVASCDTGYDCVDPSVNLVIIPDGPNAITQAKQQLCKPAACDHLGGVCVGPGNSSQTSGGGSSYNPTVTYANTDCSGGAIKNATCSKDNTFCCPSANVIQTVDSGIVCIGPDGKTQGTCWYNVLANGSGSTAFITNESVIRFSGKTTLYTTTKGGNGICGTSSELPYFMPNGTPTACFGSGAEQPNPKCSDGKETGICFTNNSCGDGHEINSIKTGSYNTCGSYKTSGGQPYRICCAGGSSGGGGNDCGAENQACCPTGNKCGSNLTCNSSNKCVSTGGGGGGGNGNPTNTPVPCQNGKTTQMALNLKLDGIGTGSFDNHSPAHTSRDGIYVRVTDQSGTSLYNNTTTKFNFGNGSFNGAKVSLGTSLVCGKTYTVAVKIPRYLPAKATVDYGTDKTIDLNPIVGDINKVSLTTKAIIGDDKIDINDYAIVRACHNVDPSTPQTFTDGTNQVTITCGELINFLDYTDGGTQGDEWAFNYNAWLRGYVKANGY